jgi:hypothetical protein
MGGNNKAAKSMQKSIVKYTPICVVCAINSEEASEKSASFFLLQQKHTHIM